MIVVPYAALATILMLTILGPTGDSVTGDWIGGVRTGMAWHGARLHLRQSGDRITGTAEIGSLDLPQVGVVGSVVDDVVSLRFEDRRWGHLVFSAAQRDSALNSDSRAFRGPALRLVPARAASEESLEEYVGWYSHRRGPVLVTWGSEGGLRFFHLGMLSGTLLPRGRDRFRLAFFDQASTVLSDEARFVRDEKGTVARLEIGRDPAKHGMTMSRIADPPFLQRRLAFASGDVTLQGTLFAPRDGARHPAVVFVGGTGYSTADGSYETSLLASFLERGIAVLFYDKRGCGRSGGDWRAVTLEELAADAAAAVGALRTCAEVSPNSIGVYGISEGGWIAPIVARRDARLAFVVNQGGPAVSPLEDELDDLTAGVRALHLAPSDTACAMELARAWVELYRSQAAWPRYRAALAAARERSWFAPMASRLPDSEDDWEIQWWRKRGRLDPEPYWRERRVPSLVLIGERDETMDREKNVARFERLRAQGPPLELRVVPKADHGLRVGGRLAPGFPAQVADWILRVVG